ncbi:unnamed protein product [Meganyctiphanes norvegica]|uniref:Uncharacterized protein n=1 Tax=Meganyctiphanes norvegica TaxID=48144 RepID=A0AAV2RYJ7_MEGNR
MVVRCQVGAVAAAAMVALVLAAAIATLASIITAQQPPTPGRNCYRKCLKGDERICHFDLEVSRYSTLSRACYDCPRNPADCSRPECVAADGVRRLITVVNKQLPGPTIQVCQGDRVVVDVKNSLPASDVAIHWHGFNMKNLPYMDGTPGISQCPISPGASFKYSFVASEVGTHWWHAHTGFQRGDGVYGGLIVRKTLEDNSHMYDHDLPEHLIMVQDWLHTPTESKYFLHHHGAGDRFPESMLVNGKGPNQNSDDNEIAKSVPYQRFTVASGNRYRFRLVNAAVGNCPITVDIDQHSITAIATDGNAIRPVNASSLVMSPGESWDIVVKASKRDGTYWIKFMGRGECSWSQAHQFALLHYKDAYHRSESDKNGDSEVLRDMKRKPEYTELLPPGTQINSINSACYEDQICVADMRAKSKFPEDLKSDQADYTFYLSFEMRNVFNNKFYSRNFYDFSEMAEDQQILTPQVNNFTLQLPVSPLIVTKGETELPICNKETPPTGRTCNSEFCECLHMYKLPLGVSVDLVLVNEGFNSDESHSVHMHGHQFWVLAQGRPVDEHWVNITRAEVENMDIKGLITRNLDDPVKKDTITVPDAGYTVIRFRATNPGYWLLECNMLYHSVSGMGMVLQVGENHEMPLPPQGFPTCNNYRHSEF